MNLTKQAIAKIVREEEIQEKVILQVIKLKLVDENTM